MSINKVILLGNLGKDPVVKQFENGKIASFTLATTKKGFTTKSGNVIADKTEWHNCTAFAGLAEVAEKYLHKGSKVYIEGEIRYRVYEPTAGDKRILTDIYVDVLEMCDKPNTSSSNEVLAPQQTFTPTVENKAIQETTAVENELTEDGLPF